MLNVSALALGYGDVTVLQFAGMRLEKGAQCLIAGASGCGKTTLLYALAGISPVMAGTITVAGVEITGLSEAARDVFRGKHIGIVYQGIHLIQSLTVVQNVMLADYAAGMPTDRARAVAILTRLGLAEKVDAMPDTLSQGQAQRVAIARAALHRPSLLLADEPTSSLDDAACASVIALLKEVAAEAGSTLVIATHDGRVKEHFSEVVAL